MDARIRVDSGSDPQAELSSLREWLSREDELRGRVTIEVPASVPDRMGDTADVLVAALGSSGAVTVLATSIRAWLSHRRPDVEIEVTGPDGRSVKVNMRHARNADAAEAIRRALDGMERGDKE
ncbi:effector-associated constant component EACC1 [Amycolatopsis sp. cmx-4-68]|uniref:effector-associated constant component EACC1 n=1 Tax=Amycolatopsis sp. cmx-4-68 TaxID=2790938 RepID=UPI0039794E4A